MAKLLFQGHGSFRITAGDNTVIYVDPYIGDGYDLPADLILVTHQHGDHNQIDLCPKKTGCVIITEEEALDGGRYNSFEHFGVKIKAVPAENKNHNPAECVGFIITADGKKLYAAADTSKTAAMENMPAENLDYTLLPCDGVYNMDLDEAAECARLIKARKNIPIHMKPGALFCPERAAAYTAPDKLIVAAGEEIEL